MRRRGWFHFGGFGLLVLCLPLLALAAEPQAPQAPERPAATGEGYVVKKGDTLWGISKDLYDDPFLWPRLWERNPFIKDPNRIFPGDTLALPGKGLAPVPEPPKAETPKPAAPPVAKAPEPPAPPPPPPPPAPQPVAVPQPPQPPLSEYALACTPVVLDESTLSAGFTGKIIRSDNAQLLISQMDYVFVGMAGGQVYAPGDRLAVVRTGQRVMHPVSKKPLGRALLTQGILEVVGISGPTVKARVTYSCGTMSVGDAVQNYQIPPYPVGKDTEPATRQVRGVIVESLRGEQLLGAYSLVFVDVGATKGVVPGDVLTVMRPSASVFEGGSAKAGQVFPIAPEHLGEGVILRAGQEAATVVLTRTAKEALAGDEVVLSRQPKP